MGKPATALALVKRQHLNSVSYIPPSKTNLSPLQQRRAVRIYSPSLPPGWQGYWKLKRYGNNIGAPNICPKCGKTVTQLAREDHREIRKGWRRTYLTMHLAVAH